MFYNGGGSIPRKSDKEDGIEAATATTNGATGGGAEARQGQLDFAAPAPSSVLSPPLPALAVVPPSVPPALSGTFPNLSAQIAAAEERITRLERGEPLTMEMAADDAQMAGFRERERCMADPAVVPNPRKHPDVIVFFAAPSGAGAGGGAAITATPGVASDNGMSGGAPVGSSPSLVFDADDAFLLREEVRLCGVFWPEADTPDSGRLLFRAADGGEMHVAAPPSWGEAGRWPDLVQTLTSRNRRLRLHVPTRRQVRAATVAAIAQPLPQTQTLCHPDNPLHKATFYALARKLDDGQSVPPHTYRVGIAQSNTRQNLQFYFGLREDERADSLISLLARLRGAAMVKVHYALWGRFFEQGGGDSPAPVALTLNQFCDDLGFARHPKGGHRRTTKREVTDLLHLLSGIQMEVYNTIPQRKKMLRYHDRLWTMSTLEGVEYRDLQSVTATQGSDLEDWQLEAFRFRPGHWYDAPEYREQFGQIGKVSAGLMRLSATNADEWPLLIGGYLATLMRVNRYGSIRVRWRTILHQTGLAQDDDALAHPARTLARLARALNRLCDVGVLRDWREDTESALAEPMPLPAMAELSDATPGVAAMARATTWDETDEEISHSSAHASPLSDSSSELAADRRGSDNRTTNGGSGNNSWRDRVVQVTLPDIFAADRARLGAAMSGQNTPSGLVLPQTVSPVRPARRAPRIVSAPPDFEANNR